MVGPRAKSRASLTRHLGVERVFETRRKAVRRWKVGDADGWSFKRKI
jgi:hypothetical protein